MGPATRWCQAAALSIDADLLALALRTNLAVSSSMHSLAVVPNGAGKSNAVVGAAWFH